MFATRLMMLVLVAGAAAPALAAVTSYDLDPDHTYPSFEADHLGISVWRGKFNHSIGKLTIDKATGNGTVNVTIEVASIDFGNEKLNAWAMGPEFLDVASFPQASYQGRLTGFRKGAKPRVTGQLTLHGVTRPVDLRVNSFRCIAHPLSKRDYCGADALVMIKRDEFGLSAGKDYGFSMDVMLRIQVEAIATE